MRNDISGPPPRKNYHEIWNNKQPQRSAAPFNQINAYKPRPQATVTPERVQTNSPKPKFRFSKKYLLALPVLLVVAGGIWWTSKGADSNLEIPIISQSPGVKSDNEQSEGEQQQVKTFDKSKYSLTDPSSIWVVVNKSRPLDPLNYAPPDLVTLAGGQQMRKEAADALQQMFNTAATKGLQLQALSGYRSYETQQAVYANEVATYGQAVADTQSAKPGHSEHQTGFGMDLGGGGCGIEDCFGDTAEGKWVAANAHKYGYIIRYVSGKESITGYRPEPWHLRYVGKELAAEMNRTGTKTLEEFFNL